MSNVANSSWSPQQEEALRRVREWLKDKSSQVFYLAGYAGTGKTTLARELAGGVKGLVLYGAFTGKAALVLRKKGCDNASTIHSMIYRMEDEEETTQPRFVLNRFSEVADAKLVIIDEVSMVDEKLGADLLSFGTKVLVLGDPAQLPPVGGEGFFTKRDPDMMLTEVHRQAEGNPIIAMSMAIRQGRKLQLGSYGESRVIRRKDVDQAEILACDQLLVGLNKTRRLFNARMRVLKGYDQELPMVGERLICLKNNKEKRLLNGGLWTVQQIRKVSGKTIDMAVVSDDYEGNSLTDIVVMNEFFRGTEDKLTWQEKKGTDEFTFGYALTTHKSQGSQWDHIVVFDESSTFREEARNWLYTAVTRAAEKITIVQG